jgi:hypothetical protein
VISLWRKSDYPNSEMMIEVLKKAII